MSRLSYVHALTVILAVAACGGSSKEPAKAPPPSSPPAAHTAADLVPMCKRLFARKATCADDYLPVLLDLRVELNMPPGIGDKVKTEGRAAVLAIAHTELARDTEPARVEALCTSFVPKLPPEQIDPLLDEGGKCEANPDCKAFAVCAVAIDRGFITHAHAPVPAESPH